MDAICINQLDDLEKDVQVGMMGEIYSSAASVSVWIGEPAPYVSPVSLWPLGMLVPGMRNDRSWKTMGRKLLNEDGKLDSAIKNSSPPWHTRAWVVQELLLAKEVYICYGDQRALFTEEWLKEVAPPSFTFGRPEKNFRLKSVSPQIWNNVVELLSQLETRFQHQEIRSDYRRRNQEEEPLPIGIFEGTDILRNTNATNPRDMVYSMLGLMNQPEAKMVGSDTITCAQTFVKATYASMTARQDLDILVLRSFNAEAMEGLPSWAIDFRESVSNRNAKLDDPGAMYLFNQPISKGLDFLKAQPTLSDSNTKLAVPGVVIGVVSGQTMDLPHDADNKDAFLEIPARYCPAVTDEILRFAGRSAIAFQSRSDEFNDLGAGRILLRRVLDSRPLSIFGSREQQMIPFADKASQKRLHAVLEAMERAKADKAPVTCFAETNVLYHDEGMRREDPEVILPPPSLSFLQSSFALKPGAGHERYTMDDLRVALTLYGLAVREANEETMWENELLKTWLATTAVGGTTAMKGTPFFPRLLEYLTYPVKVKHSVSFFETSNGLFGIAPSTIQEDDIIVLVRSSAPYLILRPIEDHFEFRGLAYIHCLTDQDCWDNIRTSDIPVKQFTLV